MSIENQIPITIQRTDLVVLDEIILAATTTKAYDTISSGTHPAFYEECRYSL